MTFRVELARSAARAFERAPRSERRRLERAIDALARNPRPPGKLVKAIQATKDDFLRMRVGDYRIVYEVVDADRVVLILGIVQRKDLEQWLRQHG
ncbi:MAG: type II toxin-antitoxin system RelE/ParE family toxin [Candidatus Dormibacteraeota bacterium]|nr:type II toxin-antitoxin system RelE/ParE family toxin [Candidatus Dormibacteraeota bacterium]